MSKPKDVKAKWDATFADYVSIQDLRAAVRRAPQLNPCVEGFRSVCWKAFLLHQNIDRSSWPKVTRDSRGAYDSLKEHLLRDLKAPEGESTVDPLADTDEAQWQTLKADEALRVEIMQDVERCMPEIALFRREEMREMLLNVLFVYCKINADLGYRQGMHELLAPLVWVLHQDAEFVQAELASPAAAAETTSAAKTPRSPRDDEKTIIADTVSVEYVEHDAFSLFCIIMQTAKAFYEMVSGPTKSSPGGGSSSGANESPIVERSRRIHEEYLSKSDPELAAHLTSIDILPQIFVIRWIRLLFGREFPFGNVLALWDMIFAEDPALTLVDHICLAMLLRVRWQLLEADYSTALTVLLRYPEPATAQQTAALVGDAVYLNKHMDLQGGLTIIRKYTGRAPLAALAQAGGEPVKRRGAHTPQSGSLDLKNFKPLRSPAEYIHNQGGLESILQGAAKNVYSRSEQWGLNKAIRGAVQNFQNNALTPPPPHRSQHGGSVGAGAGGGSRWSLDEGRSIRDSPSSATLEKEVKELHSRNQRLAKMLSEAVDELSQQSKSLEEKSDEPSATALTLTVAKLQYLQVHLEDSQLPLDNESPAAVKDDRGGGVSGVAGTQDRSASDSGFKPRNPPASPTPPSRSRSGPGRKSPVRLTAGAGGSPEKSPPSVDILPAKTVVPQMGSVPRVTVQEGDEEAAAKHIKSLLPPAHATHPPRQPGNFAQSRPSLSESSYSWMLGEDRSTTSHFAAASAFSPGHERNENVRKKSVARSKAGFLFGDKEEEEKKKSSTNTKGQKAGDRKDEDDGFTMGTLKGGPELDKGPL